MVRGHITLVTTIATEAIATEAIVIGMSVEVTATGAVAAPAPPVKTRAATATATTKWIPTRRAETTVSASASPITPVAITAVMIATGVIRTRGATVPAMTETETATATRCVDRRAEETAIVTMMTVAVAAVVMAASAAAAVRENGRSRLPPPSRSASLPPTSMAMSAFKSVRAA